MNYATYLTTVILSIFNYITFSSGSEICNPLLEKPATFSAKIIQDYFFSQNQGNATSERLNYKMFLGKNAPGPP